MDRAKTIIGGIAVAAAFIAWGVFLPDRHLDQDQQGRCVEVTTYFALFTTVEPC